MDKKILEYINKQKSPQKEILKEARKIILETLPGCNEEARWGVIAFAGGKFYIAALRDSVNVGFAIGGLEKNEVGMFSGGGKTMRHIKIREKKEIDREKLVKLLKFVNKKAKCRPC